jgi:hypothetical protein
VCVLWPSRQRIAAGHDQSIVPPHPRRRSLYTARMIVPSGERVRVVKAAPTVRDPGALAAFITSPAFLDAARVLKVEDERSSVLLGELPGELASVAGLTPRRDDHDADMPARVVVKVMAHDRPVKHFFQRLFGTTRHQRQWRGAELLLKHGFAAARPMVLFRACCMAVGEHSRAVDAIEQAEPTMSLSPALSQGERGPEARRAGLVEVLVLEWLPGKTLLQHMADRDLTLKQEHALADAVAEAIRKLARAGVSNYDCKPSNWIVRWNGDQPKLSFADTVAVGKDEEGLGPLDHASMLIYEPTGVGCFPRRALCWRVTRAIAREQYVDDEKAKGRFVLRATRPSEPKEFWRLLVRYAEYHGDPTPRVNPLSSSPSIPAR